jgi:hypothetical protein
MNRATLSLSFGRSILDVDRYQNEPGWVVVRLCIGLLFSGVAFTAGNRR